MQLTILFQDPYWVGILESIHDDKLYIARYIFGSEPGDAEVYEMIQRDWPELMARMTIGVSIEASVERAVSPKRRQREIRRAVAERSLSTKAQEAMRLQIEEGKQTRKANRREEREAMKAYKREKALEKLKEKRRGH
jgi:hypothetical protein